MTELDRRTFLRLAGLGLGAVGLAACAGTQSTAPNRNKGRGGGKVDTLTFWSNHPGGSKPIETELLAAYKAQGGPTVQLIDAGATYEELAQKFNAALTGGDLPDVIIVSDVTWFNFALNKAITPMDELWSAANVETDGYVTSLREDYLFEKQHFALPYARSTPLFYYNKKMWSAAGLPDRGPETWQEFAEWAPRLAAANPKIAPMTVPDGRNYLDWYFQGMIWTFGGSYSKEWEPTFTAPGSLKAGEFLQEQVRQQHIAITNDANNQFGAGQAASLLQSTGSLRGLTGTAKFDFGTAFLPGPRPGCPTGGAGVAIPNGISDERKEAAMRFIAFLTNTDNTLKFTQATGYMPVRKDAITHPETEAYLQKTPNARTALEQLAVTAPQDHARVFVPGGGARIGGGLDRVTTGRENVQTVFQGLSDETKKVYERDIKPKL